MAMTRAQIAQTAFWVVLYLMLGAVATAAAVLSFSALKDLAELCGFDPRLSWLLPVTVDAGAAAASAVWLVRWVPPGARTYGRALALVLLGSSVAGNALDHYLRAYRIDPDWRVVVLVSAVAPAVLATLVHLVMLVSQATHPTQPTTLGRPAGKDGGDRAKAGSGASVVQSPPSPRVSLVKAPRPPAPTPPPDPEAELFAQILALVHAEPKIGRPRITQALGVTDTPRLRAMVARAKEHAASTNGAPTP